MCSWRVSRTRHSCVTGARRGPARSHAGPARTGDTLLPGHKRALLRETAGGVAAPGGGQTGPYKATGAPVEARPEAAGSLGASATAEPPASRASVSRSWRHCAFVSVLCRNCDGLNATKRRAQLVRRLKARGWSLLCLPPTACSLPPRAAFVLPGPRVTPKSGSPGPQRKRSRAEGSRRRGRAGLAAESWPRRHRGPRPAVRVRLA